MNYFAVILSSTVIGAIITAFLNWIKNKKNNSLLYITKERKKWRKKIRCISLGIRKSCFNGNGERNIETYLIQLQLCINPYGKGKCAEYLSDGHIWEIIEQIRLAKNKTAFENDKSILLDYLALLLKYDWERSKEEVVGFQQYKGRGISFFIYLIANTLIYFVFLNIQNISFYLLQVVLTFVVYVVIFFLYADSINDIKKDRTRLPMVKEKETNKIFRSTILGYMLILLLQIIIIFYGYPEQIFREMSYVENNNTIYIYTKLNENYVSDFKTNIERDSGKDIVLCLNKEDFEKQGGSLKENKKEEAAKGVDNIKKYIKEGIKNSIFLWQLISLYLQLLIIPPLITTTEKRNNQYINEVEKIYYSRMCGMARSMEYIMEIIDILEKADDKKDPINKKIKRNNRKLKLQVIHSNLVELKKYINSEIIEKKKGIRSLSDLEYIQKQKDNLCNINSAIKQCKKNNRKITKLRKYIEKIIV